MPFMKQVIPILLLLAGLQTFAGDSPRERLLMDFNWRFHLGDTPDAGSQFDYPEVKDLAKTRVDEIGEGARLVASLPDLAAMNLGGGVAFVKPDFDDSGWHKLDLPHDWAVELPFNENADLKHGFKPVGDGFPENSIGWYRRAFDLPASDKGRALWIEFDGVYRNSLVWLNGHCLGRNVSGYSSFRYDISKAANYGGKNELVVRVDASRFEGWFYEGAGIYRHVWLEKAAAIHVAPHGIFVYSKFTNDVPEGPVTANVETRLDAPNPYINATVQQEIFSPEGKFVAKFVQSDPVDHDSKAAMTFTSSELWSPETPRLYRLVTTVEIGGQIVDRVETPFGIRTIAFDAEKGFLLNGKPYVIKGTCNHQDHAGVGAAMPDALQYFRIKKLKEMGSNAIRTSHNPPTPELLDACDRLGMLVMDENRRVDDTPQAADELQRLITRDRNHPSVFIWSLGNEEMYLQGTKTNEGVAPATAHDAAIRVITKMQNQAHELDPTRLCTIAMNGGWGEGFSKVIDVQGLNYHTANIEKFRTKFPAKLSIGTETASTRVTRGVYADDKERGYVAAYGENGVEKAWTWWPYFATHPFTSGGFVWTGFDYRGEPTPYKWPCISSHFGLMDTCGFPKDLYYYYLAWWGDKPVLHLTPDWTGQSKEGQTNLVRCFSNCKRVELFLNGKSLGKKEMAANEYLDWNVAYAPGVLSAKGYNGTKLAAETKVETVGAPAAIRVQPDRFAISADGQDLSIMDVSVVDSHGRVVPDADNLIQFDLKGAGKIIGVGNGDPSSHEADEAGERHVFKGLAQVIVEAGRQPGKIELSASSKGLKSATVKITAEAGKSPLAILP
jgi:beta-galactosidase